LYLWVGMVPELFRSGWFVESLLTQLLTIFIVRTSKPFYRSKPATWLMVSALVIGLLTLALPYSPAASWFGLVPLPLPILVTVLSISLCYMAAAEVLKRVFYQRDRQSRSLQRRPA